MKLCIWAAAAAVICLSGCANFKPGDKELSCRVSPGGHQISGKVYNAN